MATAHLSAAATTARSSIRDEVLRAQLRPVLAMALTATTLVGLLIAGLVTWQLVHLPNPLDEIEARELRPVLRSATPEQWPVLVRWIAIYGLHMRIDAAEASRATLFDGRQVPLTEAISIVRNGQRLDAGTGQPLGPAPATWLEAIARLPEEGTLRLSPAGEATSAETWPALLLRLDAERVVVLANPDAPLPAADLASILTLFFALSGTVSAGFVALFLLAFRRRYANRSAERLSAPLERLAATVRLAAAERDATRRAAIEGPAEVAQLAEDVNRLQEHLAQALAERDRVIGAQRDLVASLSHELRTPLAVLNGHAELLSRDAGSAARAQVMLRQLEDLHRLLSDLLDMTRLESIEATLAPQPVVLAAVVQEMVERFSAAAWRQGVVLRAARTPPSSLAAQADPRWLRQIVANLLSNAIRHTPQGGLVTLDIEARDGTVALVIEDTGIGLDTARASQDLVDRSAGIGLRLVRRLATAMRGSLRLEHTEEGGTRATVHLPAAPQP